MGSYHLADDGAQLYHYGPVLPSNLYSGGKGCAIMALVVKLYLVCAGSCWGAFFWLSDRQAYRPPRGLSTSSYYFLVYSCGGVMAHWLPVLFILFGAGGGMIPLINALLAERYGTNWLGEIKALAMPMNVASALSPAPNGHSHRP